MKAKENIRAIEQLRWIGIAEGVSFLLLLLIAMPLKYMYDYPLPVKITGWIHGLLFMLYIAAVLRVAFAMKWKFSRIALFLSASVLPLATFILDKSLKEEELAQLKASEVRA